MAVVLGYWPEFLQAQILLHFFQTPHRCSVFYLNFFQLRLGTGAQQQVCLRQKCKAGKAKLSLLSLGRPRGPTHMQQVAKARFMQH